MVNTKMAIRFYIQLMCLALVAMLITSAIPKLGNKEDTLKQQHYDRPFDRVRNTIIYYIHIYIESLLKSKNTKRYYKYIYNS